MTEKIRVLVVDDQTLFTQSLRTLIEKYAKDITVVGTASSGEEAIRLAESLRPHVILMDVRMPGMSGVEATGRILKKAPEIRIMILSTFDEDEYVKEALHLGAAGYLLKDIPPTELIASIRALKEGAVQISPAVAARLVDQFYDRTGEAAHAMAWFTTLSQREKDIFRMISRGYGNKQIAKELFIAEQTVRNYVSAIYAKLGVRDRLQIIQLANSLGRPEAEG